jgi:sugar (pentulose or hexulose) kinase
MENKVNKDIVLAIDNGTQSVRAILFDLKGEIVAKEQIFIEPYFSDAPGWAEQHATVYWKALCDACNGLLSRDEINKERIAAVSLTSQRATVVNVDKNGNPLRPAIVWLDQRRAENFPPVSGLWGGLFKTVALSNTVSYLQAEAEANWLMLNEPEIWGKTHKFLFLSGYLTNKLVDNFVDSVGCQVGYVPFDYKKQKWAGRLSWKWKAIPMNRSMLPKLVIPGKSLGKITKEAAAETGIPQGLPLIASAADKACEVLGAGCIEPHIGCLSYGTAATINTIREKYKEIVTLLPAYPAAVPHAYNLELQIYRGFWMVNWFKKEFGHPENNLANQKGVEPEELFDDLVKKVPPGSEGLVLQPYWSPGLRHPGPEARGAVIGFGDVHTRAHLYRAILEGLAYALREGAEKIAKRTGQPITELRVAGGGSQSDAALQLTADIFGLKTVRPHVYEASGLGAAINAVVGANLYPDYKTAIDNMTREGKSFLPFPQVQKVYDGLYKEVYQKMYSKLKPLYKSIQQITMNNEDNPVIPDEI